jgi:hypothetical protein
MLTSVGTFGEGKVYLAESLQRRYNEIKKTSLL